MLIIFFILAVIGFCISLYTYLTEKKIKESPEYKPLCDISDRISCTRVMKSEYSNIFYFSNALVGMLFYIFIAISALLDATNLISIGVIIADIATCVLAYLLYFKIKSLCILCTSLYVINIIMLILIVLKYLGK